jgi:hypothetical protein
MEVANRFVPNPSPTVPKDWSEHWQQSEGRDRTYYQTRHGTSSTGTFSLTGRELRPLTLDLTALLATKSPDGYFSPKYPGNPIDRFTSYLKSHPDQMQRILDSLFLMAPVGKPCVCRGTCQRDCHKTQLPNVTFLIGVLKNMFGAPDFFWLNPIQILFRDQEQVEAVSNMRALICASKLVQEINVGTQHSDPLIMNFMRGDIDQDLRSLALLKRAGCPRDAFIDMKITIDNFRRARDLDPWVPIFSQLIDSRRLYDNKPGYSRVALILDMHSSTALFFPAICRALNVLPHLQLVCYHQGAYTMTPRLSELFHLGRA